MVISDGPNYWSASESADRGYGMRSKVPDFQQWQLRDVRSGKAPHLQCSRR